MSPEPVSTISGPSNVSSRQSPEPLLTWPWPNVPSRATSALPVLTTALLWVGQADRDGVRRLAAEEAAAVALGADHADLPAVLADLDLLGVAALDLDGGGGGVAGGDVDAALAELDVQVDRLVGLELVAAHDLSPGCVRPRDRPAWPSLVVWWGGWVRVGSDPAGHAAVAALLAAPKGSLPKNGMLERSMSTLIAPSRVAARTTLTSQVLRDWPDLAAAPRPWS